jgi:hypothetical protein
VFSGELIEESDDDFLDERTRLSTTPEFSGGEPAPASAEEEWYLAVDGNQFGPMAFSELCSRVKRGETGVEAYVWREVFDDWLALGDVPELRPFVPRHPPPPPKSKSGLFPLAALTALPIGVVPPPAPPAATVPPLPAPVPPTPRIVYGIGASSPMQTSSVTAGVSGLSPNPYVARATHAPGAAASSVAIPFPSASLPDPALPALSMTPGVFTRDSAVGPLPVPSMGPVPEAMYPLPAPLLQPQPQGTPLLLKITAAAGIASLLLGIGLVVYFIVLDRPAPHDPRALAQSPGLAAGAQTSSQQDRRPDASSASVQFQPLEVEQSPHHERRVPRSAKAVTGKEGKPESALNERERNLMALYNDSQGPSPGASTAPSQRKRSRMPTRAVTSDDILGMQRKHKAALKACYEHALKRDESLAQLKADVMVTVDDNGLVKEVKIGGVDNTDLVGCLTKDIRRWAFEPMGEQTFRFPIVFRGS